MNTNHQEKKIPKSDWLRNDTQQTLKLAKQLKLEQAIIDLIFNAHRNLELPFYAIRDSVLNAIQDAESSRVQSIQIMEALS